MAYSSAQAKTDNATEMLQRFFGFPCFREGQAEIVDAILAGEDVLVVMPTGAGKSLCFQLPAQMRDGFTVVVSPLIALMENQIALLKASGIAAAMLHSGRSREENICDWQAVTAGAAKLLYMSPERLATPRMRQALAKLPVTQFVIDEAHCISQWGHDFRKEYLALADLKQNFPHVPLAAFTATADANTRKDLQDRLFGGKAKSFVFGFDRPNITLRMEEKHQADNRVLEIVEARRGQQGIVYCLSRKSTEITAEKLSAAGHKALAYHAKMPDEQRAEILNRFLTEPDIVICATIAFGMGIDKPDIRYVIHRDMPSSMEAYYQEIGRAGRDGAPADAIMLYGMQDLMQRRRMIDESEAPDEIKRLERRRLDALAHYCDGLDCRRIDLLGHFGDEQSAPCGNCDRCLDGAKTQDGTALAQKALQVILSLGENFGQQHIIHILTGANTEKIRQRGHDSLVDHGCGKELDARQWRALFRQLYAQKIIEPVGDYNILQLTARGRQVLAGALEVPVLIEEKRRRFSGRGRGQKSLAQGQVNAKLLSALKALRLKLAKAKNSPAFVIFADRTLIEMAQRQPKTIEEFAALSGVGEKKCAAYAEIFLQALREFENGTDE